MSCNGEGDLRSFKCRIICQGLWIEGPDTKVRCFNNGEHFRRLRKEIEKEFAYFLNIAHGSAAEFQSHLYIALDLGYIDKDSFDHLYMETEEISKMILGLQNYLRKLVRS